MIKVGNVVHSDPAIMSGEPVFVGTRVLLKNLIDYLAAGDSLENFLESFPSVTRAQATAALEFAGDALSEIVRTAALAAELDWREAETDADPEGGNSWSEIKKDLARKIR